MRAEDAWRTERVSEDVSRVLRFMKMITDLTEDKVSHAPNATNRPKPTHMGAMTSLLIVGIYYVQISWQYFLTND